MVGRLVQKKDLWLNEQCSRQSHSHSPASTQLLHHFLHHAGSKSQAAEDNLGPHLGCVSIYFLHPLMDALQASHIPVLLYNLLLLLEQLQSFNISLKHRVQSRLFGLFDLLLNKEDLHTVESKLVPSKSIHQACLTDPVSSDQTVLPPVYQLQGGLLQQISPADYQVHLVDYQVLRHSLRVVYDRRRQLLHVVFHGLMVLLEHLFGPVLLLVLLSLLLLVGDHLIVAVAACHALKLELLLILEEQGFSQDDRSWKLFGCQVELGVDGNSALLLEECEQLGAHLRGLLLANGSTDKKVLQEIKSLELVEGRVLDEHIGNILGDMGRELESLLDEGLERLLLQHNQIKRKKEQAQLIITWDMAQVYLFNTSSSRLCSQDYQHDYAKTFRLLFQRLPQIQTAFKRPRRTEVLPLADYLVKAVQTFQLNFLQTLTALSCLQQLRRNYIREKKVRCPRLIQTQNDTHNQLYFLNLLVVRSALHAKLSMNSFESVRLFLKQLFGFTNPENGYSDSQNQFKEPLPVQDSQTEQEDLQFKLFLGDLYGGWSAKNYLRADIHSGSEAQFSFSLNSAVHILFADHPKPLKKRAQGRA